MENLLSFSIKYIYSEYMWTEGASSDLVESILNEFVFFFKFIFNKNVKYIRDIAVFHNEE